MRDVLFRAAKARLAGKRLPPVLRELKGLRGISRALEVDESPIGRTPRSVPATYVGIMDAIRTLFAAVPDARALGYGKSRFSFNVKGGRCERCEGQGRLRVTMALLPDTYVPCEACRERRYNADTLAVAFKGKSVAEVLAMTIDEARQLFSAVGAVRRPLDFLSEIGLGYLQLGQPSPTLSGGEAQRIKLAAELTSPGFGPSLFVLDEPTTGLHMADVARLTTSLQRLVDRGDSVIVIEHNLDLIAAADCVIDLGPEGGDKGGRVVAWGTPEQVARSKASRTAPYLREHLKTKATLRAPSALLRERLRGAGAAGAVHPDLAFEEGAVGDRHHARLDARTSRGRGSDLDLVGDERRAAHLVPRQPGSSPRAAPYARALAHAAVSAHADVAVERARHVHRAVGHELALDPRAGADERACSGRPLSVKRRAGAGG